MVDMEKYILFIIIGIYLFVEGLLSIGAFIGTEAGNAIFNIGRAIRVLIGLFLMVYGMFSLSQQ